MGNLKDYLAEAKYKKYQLGTFDCYTFTNDCWEILYGRKWSEEFLNAYSSEGDWATVKSDKGWESLEEAIDAFLSRCSKPLYGNLVTLDNPTSKPFGKSMGICLGQFSVFVSHKGITYIPTNLTEYSWNNHVTSSV